MSSVRRSGFQVQITGERRHGMGLRARGRRGSGFPRGYHDGSESELRGRVLRGRHVPGDVQSGSQRGLSRDRPVLGEGCF